MRRYAKPLFIVYVLSVVAVTIPPVSHDPTNYWGAAGHVWTPIQYLPFEVDAPSFLLNVVMFLPLGVLLPLVVPRVATFWRMLACAAGASLLIEMSQLVVNLTLDGRRTVDINDLIANTVGALLGLGLLRLALPDHPSR